MKKLRQKRVALINDITGFGRCSSSVQQPIISAMKIQACVFPTAILSTHTCFPDYFIVDFTQNMESYMKNWSHTKINFDGILTGFLGSIDQINIVLDFFEKFKKEKTCIVVDPVMGDNGKLYHSFTNEMCLKMKKLLFYADVITPNLTEACYLLGIDYNFFEASFENLEKMAYKVTLLGAKKVVITGIPKGNKIWNFVYSKESKIVETEKIGESRTGCGDVFTAIVMASLINGEELYEAVLKAVHFINKVIKFTVKLNIPLNYGLGFEEYLSELK